MKKTVLSAGRMPFSLRALPHCILFLLLCFLLLPAAGCGKKLPEPSGISVPDEEVRVGGISVVFAATVV